MQDIAGQEALRQPNTLHIRGGRIWHAQDPLRNPPWRWGKKAARCGVGAAPSPPSDALRSSDQVKKGVVIVSSQRSKCLSRKFGDIDGSPFSNSPLPPPSLPLARAGQALALSSVRPLSAFTAHAHLYSPLQAR